MPELALPDQPLLAPLAEWCASGGPRAMQADLRERIGMVALDWLGALAAGSRQPAAGIYREAAGRLDPGGRSLADRAFLLGALSHLAEVDDGHRAAMIHPGVVTFAPLWAIGRQAGLDLGTFRAAIVAGYEAAVRCGAAFGAEHYRVFHTTATAGSFGAAAAASVAARLCPAGTLDAFGHAGTQAAGVWQFLDDGADAAKAAHAGFAARSGLAAAMLAEAGLRGAQRILEGPRGLAAAWKSPIDAGPLVAAFEPESSALASSTIKAWPVCGQMHHVLDAVVALAREEQTAPGEIEAVEVASFDALERVAGVTDPQSPAQARFSTSYCVAHVLVYGGLGFNAWSGAELPPDEPVRRLATRVRLTSHPAYDVAYPRRRACLVTLRLSGGRVRAIEHTGRRGDPENPFTFTEVQARFEDVAAGAAAGWRRAARAFCGALVTAPDEAVIPPETFRSLVDE